MNARRIVALPVDARPVVREQVCALMDAAGWELAVPPVPMLGFLRTPADRDALADWLMREALDAAGLVVSIDMLVYGGLVPSRLIGDPLESLTPRLDTLRALKAAQPDRPLFAFASTMRISNNNVAEEEKPYWAQHGEAIWQWSSLQDRANESKRVEDYEAARAAEAQVPAYMRADYLTTRARNASVTAMVLDLVEAGVIDRLILPQDDTAPFGFNIAERRRWQTEIAQRNLGDRVLIYPGADEVLHTLCAHIAGRLANAPTVRVALQFDDPEGAKAMTARYEDRPLLDTLAGQAAACGVVIVDAPDAADIVVLVHTRGAVQGDHAMGNPAATESSSDGSTTHAASLVAAGKRIAVLDCAYANGGDLPYVEALHAALPVSRWFSYAAWNTAGNRIGNLFAHCALSAHGMQDNALLAMRLFEDLLYQGHFRRQVRDRINESAIEPAALAEAVRDAFVPPANAWARAHGLGWRIRDTCLPWNRTFEIGLELEHAA